MKKKKKVLGQFHGKLIFFVAHIHKAIKIPNYFYGVNDNMQFEHLHSQMKNL